MRRDLKLNCISCGHSVSLDEHAYADYVGEIKCNACTAILTVKIEDGKLKVMEFVKFFRPSPEDFLLR